MAMEWLKGLVGPVAQFSPTGQPVPGAPGAPAAYPQAYGAPAPGAPGGAPPAGAAPPGAWGPPPGASWDPGAPPIGGAPMAAPADPAAFGGPGAYSPPPATYGAPTPTYNAPAYSPPPAYGAPATTPAAPGTGWNTAPTTTSDARIQQLEARCEGLQRDLESLALFAQTLLAVLEDKKVMTTQDFQETRRKLDLMDGRLDDRIGKAG